MSKAKLLSAWFCPYAQRAWIAFELARVPYELVEVLKVASDTVSYEKDPLLLRHNPRGLVPTILDPAGERAVTESLTCVELADELAAERGVLLPGDAYKRGQMRMLAAEIDRDICSPFYRVFVRKEDEERREAFNTVVDGLVKFATGRDDKGPFYYGASPTIVDIALFPWAYRFYLFEQYRGASYALPTAAENPALAKYYQWYEAMLGLEGVRATLQDKTRLAGVYQRYADGTAKSKVADAVRANKPAHQHE